VVGLGTKALVVITLVVSVVGEGAAGAVVVVPPATNVVSDPILLLVAGAAGSAPCEGAGLGLEPPEVVMKMTPTTRARTAPTVIHSRRFGLVRTESG